MSEPKRYDVGMTTEFNPHGFNHSFPRVYEAEQGKYVEYEDYARLKAEVERLTAEPDALTAYLYADTLRRDDIKTLKAEVERLTKAGDAIAQELIACYSAEGYDPSDSDTLTKWFSDKWNAAKEGKGQP